jgi:hypothetical protein
MSVRIQGPVTSPSSITVLDVVSLLVDVPEHGLVRGNLGTVVDELGDEFFEVEFSDDSGRTYAELALNGAVLQLHHRSEFDGDQDQRSDQEWLIEINRRAARATSGESHSQPWPAVRDALLCDLTLRRRGNST